SACAPPLAPVVVMCGDDMGVVAVAVRGDHLERVAVVAAARDAYAVERADDRRDRAGFESAAGTHGRPSTRLCVCAYFVAIHAPTNRTLMGVRGSPMGAHSRRAPTTPTPFRVGVGARVKASEVRVCEQAISGRITAPFLGY